MSEAALVRLAIELEVERPPGEVQARRIREALEGPRELRKPPPLPALSDESWCQRCGYPKAGHGTWEKCGGWL